MVNKANGEIARTVLVVGTGYVGEPLCRALAAQGHRVIGLRRSETDTIPGVDCRRADVTDPGSLRLAWPDRVDDLVFCAARGGDQGYDDLYVRGVENLSRVVGQMGGTLRRAIFVSSTGVYGQHQGEWVDESTVPEPTRDAGLAMLQAESILRTFPGETVVVRSSGLYGPGRARLVRAVRQGEDRPTRQPSTWLNQIHRDDCVGALRHMLDVPGPQPVYIATDDEPALREDVLTWVAQKMGLPAPAPHVGEQAVGKRCSNRRLLDSGYAFQFPTYREGYAQVLAAESRLLPGSDER